MYRRPRQHRDPGAVPALARPAELALATQEELESVIRSTGFYHSKARNLLGAAQRVVSVYGGEVPPRLDELITLPGVARKTANVVLFGAFGINEGLAVDTHVKRISYRLGLTSHTDPVDIEQDLMRLFPVPNGATSITAWSGSAAMSATPAAPAARNARWPTSAPAANRPRENSCWGKERGGRGELWLAHKVPPFPHTPILLQTRFIRSSPSSPNTALAESLGFSSRACQQFPVRGAFFSWSVLAGLR